MLPELADPRERHDRARTGSLARPTVAQMAALAYNPPMSAMSKSREWASRLPGEEIVAKGLRDLAGGVESTEALLVSMAPSRLREVGHPLRAPPIPSPEERLYRLLAAQHGDGAHSKYNAWRRRLVSFLRAARCALR